MMTTPDAIATFSIAVLLPAFLLKAVKRIDAESGWCNVFNLSGGVFTMSQGRSIAFQELSGIGTYSVLCQYCEGYLIFKNKIFHVKQR